MRFPLQTVYSKALILFVGLSLLLGAAVVLLTQAIILKEFKQTEQRTMAATLQRFGVVLTRESLSLEKDVNNWNPDSKKDEAPTEEELLEMQVSFFAVLNAKTEIEQMICVDDEVRKLLSAFSRELTSYLGATFSESVKPGRTGFILLGNNLVAISWVALVLPDGKMRYQVVGKISTKDSWAFLEGLFSAQIAFQPLDGVRTGEEGSEPLLVMLTKHEYHIEESGDELRGFTLVRGINGQPLGKIQLTQKRPLFREGLRAVQVFLTILTIAGGALFLLVWFLLDRTILARIRDLTRKLEKEKKVSRLPVQLDFKGDDELGHLARSIEELAFLLEQAQHQYRSVVEDQTEIICRFDAQYRITFANGIFRKVFNMESASQTSLANCLPASSFQTLISKCASLSPVSSVDTFLHEIALGAAGAVWFRSTIRGNFSSSGAFTGGQWVAADITLQVQAQQKVLESESRLRSLSGRLLRLQDEERRRIARELHDSTAQSLSGLEMNMSLLEPLITEPRAQRLMADTRQIAQSCCQELRNISYLLHPPLLDEVGLSFAVQWFVDGFIKRTGIKVSLQIEEGFPRLQRDAETTLFRVIQEAMSNIYRHSEADHAWITVRRDEHHIVLEVRDNGRGLPESFGDGQTHPQADMGVGLLGMKERLLQFNGDLRMENSPYGVSIVILLPLQFSV